MASAVATRATAVAVTVSTYERSDAALQGRTDATADAVKDRQGSWIRAARREAPRAMRVARAVAGT